MNCVIITGSAENRQRIMDYLWKIYYFEKKNRVVAS